MMDFKIVFLFMLVALDLVKGQGFVGQFYTENSNGAPQAPYQTYDTNGNNVYQPGPVVPKPNKSAINGPLLPNNGAPPPNNGLPPQYQSPKQNKNVWSNSNSYVSGNANNDYQSGLTVPKQKRSSKNGPAPNNGPPLPNNGSPPSKNGPPTKNTPSKKNKSVWSNSNNSANSYASSYANNGGNAYQTGPAVPKPKKSPSNLPPPPNNGPPQPNNGSPPQNPPTNKNKNAWSNSNSYTDTYASSYANSDSNGYQSGSVVPKRKKFPRRRPPPSNNEAPPPNNEPLQPSNVPPPPQNSPPTKSKKMCVPKVKSTAPPQTTLNPVKNYSTV